PVRFQSGQRSVSPRNNEWDDAPVPAFRRSADIDDAAFAVFGAPGEQAAVTAPGQRRDRCVARFLGQDLGTVLDAGQQEETVVLARATDIGAGMAGDNVDAVARWCQQPGRLAHRTVLALERPQHKLARAPGG